jgi:hypothetical protein
MKVETALLACVTLLLGHHLYSTLPARSETPAARRHVAVAAA